MSELTARALDAEVDASLQRVQAGTPSAARDWMVADLAGVQLSSDPPGGPRPASPPMGDVLAAERSRVARSLVRLGVNPRTPYVCEPGDQLPQGWVRGDPIAVDGSPAGRVAHNPSRHTLVRCVIGSKHLPMLPSGFEQLDLPGAEVWMFRDRCAPRQLERSAKRLAARSRSSAGGLSRG